MKIEIVEVGPRDGLQNESTILNLEQKMALVGDLFAAGLRRVEAGAFVSAKWVPQMQDSARLMREAANLGQKKGRRLSALVPNLRGMQDALAESVKEVAVFGGCSETFSQKNINCSIEESFERFAEVLKLARLNKVRVRGYLSTAFGCPYEGDVSQRKVLSLAQRLLDLGVFEVSIGDTIGVATPKQVRKLLTTLTKKIPASRLALHYHDTRGTALANVLASLEFGIRVFDASVGGLGGCPYAKGASGNLATEDLVYMLSGMGVDTGVDFKVLVAIREKLEKWLNRRLPARSSLAGSSPAIHWI